MIDYQQVIKAYKNYRRLKKEAEKCGYFNIKDFISYCKDNERKSATKS